MRLRCLKFAGLLLFSLIVASGARAVTLDWNVYNTWTSGQPNSYNVDSSTPGNDITVAVATNNIGSGTVTMGVGNDLEGGLGPNHNTLGILFDLTTTGEYITVTISFSAAYTQGVTNVSFSLFDVDFIDTGNGSGATQFRDQIRSISATTVNNTTVGATVTGSLNNSVTGTSPNQIVNGIANTDSPSGDANVTIDFGTNAITSFTFVYGSGTLLGNKTDPTQQKIGIYNIDFTPVPEINPAWSAVISCFAAAGLILRHRATVRK